MEKNEIAERLFFAGFGSWSDQDLLDVDEYLRNSGAGTCAVWDRLGAWPQEMVKALGSPDCNPIAR